MAGSDEPVDGPGPSAVADVLDVTAVRADGDRLLYVGVPLADRETVERRVWPRFRERGYDVSVRQRTTLDDGLPLAPDEVVLVAEPAATGPESVPWRNVVLFLATVLSTLFAGAYFWYGVPVFEDPVASLVAWPFTLAIMGVLGIHELGHWVMSRYHGVDASLPYFIPLPTYIGTMGAVIRMRGRIPDRRALFDIGAAGPLAGLVATVVVTAIGLQLEPVAAQTAAASGGDGATIVFNNPPLLTIIAELTGTAARLESGLVHPVVFAGWVGMFVTLLNLLPVGQLDGGHIVRALLGERQRTVAAAVPGALFALAGYLLFVRDGADSVGIWAMWGLFALGLAYAGPATPIRDDPLDRARVAVGVLTFALGALCFWPIPVEVVPP